LIFLNIDVRKCSTHRTPTPCQQSGNDVGKGGTSRGRKLSRKNATKLAKIVTRQFDAYVSVASVQRYRCANQ
jgi:hypothetical protein